MSWPAARDFALSVGQLAREQLTAQLMTTAIASRAARVEDKAWQRWLADVSAVADRRD